MRRWVVA